MRRLLLASLSIIAIAFGVTSCETPDYGGPGTRPAPRVLMPTGLSQNEARYLPDIEDVLIRSGYRPTRDRSAEYQLEFEIDDGPINADTHLTLSREGSEVARAYARVGVPRIILHRQEFIRQSFDKCLRDFDSQLSRSGGYRDRDYDRTPSYRESDRSPYDQTGPSAGRPSYDGYERPY